MQYKNIGSGTPETWPNHLTHNCMWRALSVLTYDIYVQVLRAVYEREDLYIYFCNERSHNEDTIAAPHPSPGQIVRSDHRFRHPLSQNVLPPSSPHPHRSSSYTRGSCRVGCVVHRLMFVFTFYYYYFILMVTARCIIYNIINVYARSTYTL